MDPMGRLAGCQGLRVLKNEKKLKFLRFCGVRKFGGWKKWLQKSSPPKKNGDEKFMVMNPMGSQEFVVESLNKQKESKSRIAQTNWAFPKKNLVYFGLQVTITDCLTRDPYDGSIKIPTNTG